MASKSPCATFLLTGCWRSVWISNKFQWIGMVRKNCKHSSSPSSTLLRTYSTRPSSRKTRRVIDVKNGKWKLIGAQVFVRHGAKTPSVDIGANALSQIVWDPKMVHTSYRKSLIPHEFEDVYGNSVRDTSYQCVDCEQMVGGAPSSKLTILGQREMYAAGTALGQRYIDQFGLIPEYYDESKIYFRSTWTQRTAVTLRCIAAGIYGGKDRLRKSDVFRFYTCHEFTYEILKGTTENQNNHLLDEYHPDFTEFKDRLWKLLGFNHYVDLQYIETLRDLDGTSNLEMVHLYSVRDYLSSALHHGFDISPKIRNLMPVIDWYGSLEICYQIFGGLASNWKTGLQNSCSDLILFILDNLEAQIAKDPGSTPLQIYTTHDVALICLLSAFSKFNGVWPRFGIQLIFEVYESEEGDQWIHVIYDNKLLFEEPVRDFREFVHNFVGFGQSSSGTSDQGIL